MLKMVKLDLRTLLSKGGFRLTKWSSNDRSVLKSIPAEDRAKEVKTLDLDQDKLPIERVLGVQWCAESDQFQFKMVIKYRPATRRGILSVMASIYDPLGFLAPIILPAKMILQDLCRLNVRWDDEIPTEYFVLWQQWLADLTKLSEFAVELCFKPPNFKVKSAQLHHFSDASERGYGSVSFLRQLSFDDQIHCSFAREITFVTAEDRHNSTIGTYGRDSFSPIGHFDFERMGLSCSIR